MADAIQFLPGELDTHDPYVKYNHIEMVENTPEFTRAEMHLTPDSMNFHGIAHGGALATLADATCGFFVNTHVGPCMAVNCSMEYLRPATGNTLTCVARPVKLGKTLSIVRFEITNEAGKVTTTGTFSLFVAK